MPHVQTPAGPEILDESMSSPALNHGAGRAGMAGPHAPAGADAPAKARVSASEHSQGEHAISFADENPNPGPSQTHSIEELEQAFHDAASASQSDNEDGDPQVDPAAQDALKKEVLQVLQGIKAQAPVLEALKQQAPDAYQAVVQCIQTMTGLYRELANQQGTTDPNKAEKPMEKSEMPECILCKRPYQEHADNDQCPKAKTYYEAPTHWPNGKPGHRKLDKGEVIRLSSVRQKLRRLRERKGMCVACGKEPAVPGTGLCMRAQCHGEGQGGTVTPLRRGEVHEMRLPHAAWRRTWDMLNPDAISKLSRESVIRMLQYNDPNGVYDDEGGRGEGFEPLTEEGARGLLLQQWHDSQPLPKMNKADGHACACGECPLEAEHGHAHCESCEDHGCVQGQPCLDPENQGVSDNARSYGPKMVGPRGGLRRRLGKGENDFLRDKFAPKQLAFSRDAATHQDRSRCGRCGHSLTYHGKGKRTDGACTATDPEGRLCPCKRGISHKDR